LVSDTASKVRRPLPEGYYVDNFEVLLETVEERYADLLGDIEWAFLERFRDLSLPAKRLYVRLMSRKGPLFRRDRLSYAEIDSVDAAADELEEAGLIDRAPDTEAETLLPLLLRGELVDAVSETFASGPSAGARKDSLMVLLAGLLDPIALRRAIDERIDVIRVRHLDTVWVLRLLFFGNSRQDWTEFVLRDLGVVRYETYELRHDQRRFSTRQMLDDTLWLKRCRQTIDRCLACGEVDEGLASADAMLERLELLDPSVRSRADPILNHVGRFLERQGDLRAALRFYQQASAPPARERQIRVLAKLGRIAEALQRCEEIAADPRDETEVVFARKFSHRLRRQRGEPIPPLARRRRPQQRMVLVKKEKVSVEQLVLEALAAQGRSGFFAENWLWKSLFGLAFWDIVFSPVQGAFHHPFQFGPTDLYSPGFRPSREAAIRDRLDSLEANPDPGPDLMRIYEEKKGIANHFVGWPEDLRPSLELALSRLTGRHLAWVFDRLSRDLRRYRRGFPDLFVLRDVEPGFELLEVKAPGDQLRPEQTAWIDYLNDGGIPSGIQRVDW